MNMTSMRITRITTNTFKCWVVLKKGNYNFEMSFGGVRRVRSEVLIVVWGGGE